MLESKDLGGKCADLNALFVGLLRAVPIRWRILSIAALNSAVVVVLVAMIWSGAQVLGTAWDDVRQVRESDRILALLESEDELQNRKYLCAMGSTLAGAQVRSSPSAVTS